MIGENCLLSEPELPLHPQQQQSSSSNEDWPLQNPKSEPELDVQDVRRKDSCQECVDQMLGQGADRGSLEEDGKRVWSGVDERGCRHVRWKGLDA